MNPNLSKFLMFYSQADAGNGLTRGLENELARKTYVKTKLDRDLTEAVLNGELKIVILTGNAGDGKTAFIQMLEKAAKDRGAQVTDRDEVGSTFSLDDRQFRTLYDGSIELQETSNHQMLTDFFADFAGDDEPVETSVCLVVALNEGKLTDFLSDSTDYPWLSRVILNHLQLDEDLPDGLAVVNLNLRSVVDASLDQTQSLFDQILDRYVANEFWEACEGCPVRHRCPVKFNVDTFRIRPTKNLEGSERVAVQEKNDVARAARGRLKSILQMLHFRKRIHITVRDLRSVLAYPLFGKEDCDAIIGHVQEGDPDFMSRFYYNALFDGAEKDRIIGLIREFDIGKSSSPMTDASLSFTRPDTVEFRARFNRFSRSQSDTEDLLRLYKARPMNPQQRTTDAFTASRQYVVSLRRKLFFEGEQPGENDLLLSDLVPYRNILAFMDFVQTGEDPQGALKSAIILAISRSESIFDETLGRENICVQTRQDSNQTIRSFFTYPAEQFELSRESISSQERFIEFLPANIVLRHASRDIRLEISLDLYEMLMRIRNGYIPAAGEMKAFFLNLLMFKKQLLSTPSERLLLSGSDYTTFQLSRTPQNGVALKASN